jgi:vesicular inhibitory amino acid transporter
MRHAARLFTEQQVKGVTDPDRGREPLLVKQVEEEGKTYNVVVGQSTLPQTVFNSVNVLVGVGLLSLPLGFRYSGWIVGSLFFIFSVVTTQYTAKLLAKCLDVDSTLITFADLAYVSFGHSARIATSIVFSLELIGANVALIILFGDSLDALIPGWGITITGWKVVCCIILMPLAFLPLRLLSFTSILGILCCLGSKFSCQLWCSSLMAPAVIVAVFTDGLIKPHQPGSLRDPATTYLFPQSWLTIPLSFGLLMSPWGGHSVFPNIYRDMRHPYKYRKAVNVTYVFTFIVDLGMAVVGLLMFGDLTRDEITSNILLTPGYPKAISIFIVVAIAIIPLTKVPLNSRPIISTLEILLGLDARALSPSPRLHGMSGFTRGILKAAIRILTTVLFVGVAIVFPSFDRIMTLLGAVCCFTICLIMPLSFHLKLFGKEISRAEWWMNLVLIVVCTIMAVVSTVFACLPKKMLGA